MTQPAHRDVSNDSIESFLRDGGDHFGVDEARGDAVHRDAFPSRLERQALCEPEQPGLGGGVVGLTDAAGLTNDGADVHDPAGTTADYVLEDRLGHVEGA